jgi:hypothetical protein
VCYVAWGLIPTSAAGTDVLDCLCAIYSSQLMVRSIEVQYLLCYPYSKHLQEGFHKFIHALPIDQMEVYFLHYIPAMKQSLCNPGPPEVSNCCLWRSGDSHSLHHESYSLKGVSVCDEALGYHSRNECLLHQFVSTTVHSLVNGGLILPK